MSFVIVLRRSVASSNRRVYDTSFVEKKQFRTDFFTNTILTYHYCVFMCMFQIQN